MLWLLLIPAILILLVLIIIPFLPVKIAVDYYRLNQDDNLKIKVEALFGLITYRLELSSIKIRNWLLGPVLEVHAELFGAKGKKRDDEIIQEFGLHAVDIKTLIAKVKFFFKIINQFEGMTEMMKSFKGEDQHASEIRMENVVIYRIMGMLFLGIRGNCEKLVWRTHYGFSDAAVTALANGIIWGGKYLVLTALSIVCNIKTQPDLKVQPEFGAVGVDVQFESIFSVRIGNIMITGLKILLKEYKRRAKNRWPIIHLKH